VTTKYRFLPGGAKGSVTMSMFDIQAKENDILQRTLVALKDEYRYAIVTVDMYRVGDGLVGKSSVKGFNEMSDIIGRVNGDIIEL
jgi:hypothetical protein